MEHSIDVRNVYRLHAIRAPPLHIFSRHAESSLMRGCAQANGLWVVGGSHAINIDSLVSLRRCIVPFLADSVLPSSDIVDVMLTSKGVVSSSDKPLAVLPLRVVARVIEKASAAVGGDRRVIVMTQATSQPQALLPVEEVPRL